MSMSTMKQLDDIPHLEHHEYSVSKMGGNMQLRNTRRIVCAIVLFAVLVTGCGGGNTNKEENVKESADRPNFDYSFELDGRKYSIPFEATRFQEEGLYNDITIQANLDNDLEPDNMQILFISEDEDLGNDNLTIYIYNGTEETKKVIDCQVAGISVSVADLEYHSFSLGNGLKPGDDYETVRKVMGEPDFHDEGEKYDCAFYDYHDGRGEVRFYFHKDDPSSSKIDLTLCVKQ